MSAKAAMRFFIPVLLITAGFAIFGGWFRGTEGQAVPYQKIVAGLSAGKTIHLANKTYELDRSAPETRPPHALPESTTGDLWLTYAGDLLASQCQITRDMRGAVLQQSRFERGELITTYADGTSGRTPYLAYSLSKALKFIGTPGISVSPGSTTSATQAVANSSIRFLNQYDPVSGELTGSEEWDDTDRAAPVLLRRTSQTMEVLDADPCVQSSATPTATVTPTASAIVTPTTTAAPCGPCPTPPAQ